VAERLFLFVQLEFPWALGPPDGRYLLSSRLTGEPEHVVVLGTVSAGRAGGGRLTGRGRRAGSSGRRTAASPEPAPVPTARATVVDPISVSAESQARAWLSELDAAHETSAAVATVNRVLFAHRIAAADPHVHELHPAQALVIRAGWGEGEQLADGDWLHAQELTWPEPGAGRRRRLGRDRSAALRPQERLAVLLGAREQPLLCEELLLRARLDLDGGRLALAALELERAYATGLPELRAENRPELAIRLAELEQLRGGVAMAARAALPGEAGEPDADVVRNAVERLEAALRARSAAGVDSRD